MREEWTYQSLDALVELGWIELGRGKVISKKDLAQTPGPYPVYSSAKEADGKFGEYGLYMFDEELITWSVDGGGHLFHRPKHRFSVTNVGGTLRILKPEKLDYRFLYYMLSYVQSTIPFDWVLKAHPSVLRRLYTHLPVPPLPEQQRIVAILDEAFAGIAAATANAEKNLANARTLVDVAIEEQLSRISQGQHQETTVAQLAEDRKNSIRTGPFGSQLLHGEFVDEGIAVLGIDNVVQNQFRWDKRRYITPNKFQELARYKVLPGDVLISIMGTCGRCAVVPGDISLAINSKHLCCISLDQSRCLPEFLKLYFLHHPVAKNYLDERASGAIMAGLNMGIIKDLPVLLPCVKEQAVIAGTCERLSRGLSDLTELYSRKRANLADLKQAILQKAFSGELSGIKTRHCEAA